MSAAQIAAAEPSLRDVYDLVLEGFDLWGRGLAQCPPKVGIYPRPGAFTHAMPAYLPTKDLAGTKIISVYPGNDALGLPSANGVIVMTDAETGMATSAVDAAWITSARTAMVSMVDVAYLANPAPVFGIVGSTGATGRAHLEAIAAIYPGSRVLVGSRSPGRLEALLADFAGGPCDLVVAPGPEDIVRECDVVIVSTAHLPEPILDPEWLRPGQNILNVHTRGWPPGVLSCVDLVSCDDRRPIVDPETGLLGLYPGLDPAIELGSVVVGEVAGREDPAQVIFSFNYGLAIFDVLVADYILRRV